MAADNTKPPHTPQEIAETATRQGLPQAYEQLAVVYRFFLAKTEEAPGEYKALHVAFLFSEMPSRKPSRLQKPPPQDSVDSDSVAGQ